MYVKRGFFRQASTKIDLPAKPEGDVLYTKCSHRWDIHKCLVLACKTLV